MPVSSIHQIITNYHTDLIRLKGYCFPRKWIFPWKSAKNDTHHNYIFPNVCKGFTELFSNQPYDTWRYNIGQSSSYQMVHSRKPGQSIRILCELRLSITYKTLVIYCLIGYIILYKIHDTILWQGHENAMYSSTYYALITRFIGPTWGPSGADRTQVGSMLAPWTLLSGCIITTISLTTNCLQHGVLSGK